ncbi:MAG: hypothetical protein AB7E30_10305 [Lawsonibacter sp.]
MFDKVSRMYIDVYDGITDEYLGRTVFKITPEVENIILNYAKNNKGPDRIVLQDAYFDPAGNDYTMPLPYKKYCRKGTFKAMLRDQYSLLWIPVEIHTKYNIMGRVQPQEGQYHFDSIEYSDIVVEDVTIMTEYATDLGI